MRAGVCAAMVFLTSTPALADVAPKMTFFESAVESTGPVVYDESEAAVIRERKEAVRKRWQGMAETVRAAESSEGGAAAKARARDLAKNSIANSMNPLKTDMRRISKVLSGGDILVKEGGLSKFDYNSGTFTLQPVAAQAEKVFGAVNEIYFYALGQGGDTLRDGMQEAQGEFELWWGMVQ
ncbi:hypothetical protein B484DRAFT_476275 [Ochromonadaceae sp. CCMP2298]|nr:hypothetical protein B484DRAFT_476275 [Ochromonadaceae sp. CCMP2298]